MHRSARDWVLVVGLIASVSTGAAARDFGVDVSHYQGESGIAQARWNQMAAEGLKFAFIKGTEGLTGPDDPTMATNVARAAQAGLLAGVYHFAHPENRPTTAGAVLEADHFMQYAGSAIGPGRLRPVLDLEGRSSTLSTSALTDWVLAFVDRVVQVRGPAAEPIIYTSRSYTTSELDARVADLDLWLAYPTSALNPAVDSPGSTGVFKNWLFWQYSWTGNAGGISPVDMDVLNTSNATLASLVIPEPSLAGVAVAAVVVGRRRMR